MVSKATSNHEMAQSLYTELRAIIKNVAGQPLEPVMVALANLIVSTINSSESDRERQRLMLDEAHGFIDDIFERSWAN